jgi:cytochrome bd-type quinol oxidase subunit 1
MNASFKPNRSEAAAISAEAMVGLGITIGALGLLGLLLGWAQQMRGVAGSAVLWLCVGAAMVVLGAILAGAARTRKGRQPDRD